MSFNSIPAEINRELERRIQDTIERIRTGADAESEVKQLVNVINEAWRIKANEYAERQEEKRKRDIEELERKLREMRREVDAMRNENNSLRRRQNEQLHVIQTMMTNHLGFRNMQKEKLIDLCGSFCSVLGNLIEQHEDVEVSKTLQEEVNLQVAKILRQKSVVAAQGQDQEITEYLNSHLCSQHVPQAVNWVQIEAEILVLRSTLHEISSMISSLTPEYWDQESTNRIGDLKANLSDSTGKVLKLLEEAEAHHKSLIDAKFILPVATLKAN